MLKTIRLLLNKTNNVTRSSYLWNSLNAMLSAAESPVILAVMNRTNGLYDAGIFSIAFAVSSLMLYLGQYGLRRFQSSDIKEKYSFGEYYAMRFITCGAMMLGSLGYCIHGGLIKDYRAVKFLVIMLICFVRCIQAFSDVVHGRMQQKGRLDVATRCSAVRYVGEMISYALMLIITRNLVISTIACAVTSFVIFLLTSMNAAVDYCVLKPSFGVTKMKQLLVEGFPLFLSLFLNMYLSNAPKYAIDTYLTEEVQATYNLIFMPAFVVQLVAHFIFNPILTTYAEVWTKGDIKKLNRLIRRQILIAGQDHTGFDVDERGGQHHKVRRDRNVLLLHLFQVRQILLGDLRDLDVVDIHPRVFDQIDEQIERPLKERQADFITHIAP